MTRGNSYSFIEKYLLYHVSTHLGRVYKRTQELVTSTQDASVAFIPLSKVQSRLKSHRIFLWSGGNTFA